MKTLKTLPTPKNDNIKILEIPARKMIAIRFSGTSSPKNLEKHEKTLLAYVAKHHIKTTGAIEYAFYNPPWTLPMMRRNEILLPVESH